MKALELNIDKALQFANEQFDQTKGDAAKALDVLQQGSGAGNDFLGWLHLPSEVSAELIDRINATAKRLRDNCDYVVCIGIGGSYLGAKAVITALSDNFESYYAPTQGCPKVVFAGQNISEDYTAELERLLSGKRFGIIVISKSGTTTEPAIAFRIFKEMLEKQAGKDAAKDLICLLYTSPSPRDS